MKKKILFIVPSMLGGGAERVMLTLLKHLPREQFDVSLALIEKVGHYLGHIPDDVMVFDLKAGRVRYSLFKMIRLVNELKPDIVFSTLGHLNIALILIRKALHRSVSIIIREGTIVSAQNSIISNGELWNYLYKRYYCKADKIICQSYAMADDLNNEFMVNWEKVLTIYNPIDFINITRLTYNGQNPFEQYGKGPHVISVGRLAIEKAFDNIITAFTELVMKHQSAHLWLLGEGVLKEKLHQQAKDLGISEQVHLVGFQENPYIWMAHADLFVLSSIYEGLPNVLLEAMACGCPVVSLKHPGGTREIFEITGQLDRYVTELTWEERWFEKPSPEIKRKLTEIFGMEKVIAQYVEVFNNL